MKKVRNHLIVLGLWILTIVILEVVSINPKDATSEIPPKPPRMNILSQLSPISS